MPPVKALFGAFIEFLDGDQKQRAKISILVKTISSTQEALHFPSPSTEFDGREHGNNESFTSAAGSEVDPSIDDRRLQYLLDDIERAYASKGLEGAFPAVKAFFKALLEFLDGDQMQPAEVIVSNSLVGDKVRHVICECGKNPQLMIFHSDKNPDRLYAKCENSRCQYFECLRPIMGEKRGGTSSWSSFRLEGKNDDEMLLRLELLQKKINKLKADVSNANENDEIMVERLERLQEEIDDLKEDVSNVDV